MEKELTKLGWIGHGSSRLDPFSIDCLQFHLRDKNAHLTFSASFLPAGTCWSPPPKTLPPGSLLIFNPSPSRLSKTSRWAFLTDQLEVVSSPMEALDLLESGNYSSLDVEAFRCFVNLCKGKTEVCQ